MPALTAERLTPNVLAALSDAGLGMADLGAVVTGCGPGPFTGLRVGMATAAAFGHALGLPVFGVCSLDAIGIDTTGEVLVVTDARRREVYWARYRDGTRRRRTRGECAVGRARPLGRSGRRIPGSCGVVRPATPATGTPDGFGPGAVRRLGLGGAGGAPACRGARRDRGQKRGHHRWFRCTCAAQTAKPLGGQERSDPGLNTGEVAR